MSWLGSLVGFENLFSKGIGRDILHDPTRLITGVDPASTKVWNTVLGTDKKPLVNSFGSPGEKYYQEAQAKGIDTGSAQQFHHVADAVAGYYGAKGLAGIGSGGSGGGASTTGGSATSGSGQSGQGLLSKRSIVNALLKMQSAGNGGTGNPYPSQMPILPENPPMAYGSDDRQAREQMIQAQLAQIQKGLV